MFGKTNSVTVGSSGGGEGDILVAVNNMGTPIASGDKVWLNRHVFSTSFGQKLGWTNGYNIQAYNINNRFYCRVLGDIYAIDFNGSEWVISHLNTMDNRVIYSLQIKDGRVWEINGRTSSTILGTLGDYKPVNGVVFAENLAINTGIIRVFDPDSGEILANAGTVIPTDTISAFKFGDIAFMQDINGYYYFYDIADINEPQLLQSGQFSGGGIVAYATGLGVGDYLIYKTGYNPQELYAECKIRIFQIAEGYVLNVPEDLPQGLNNMLGKDALFSFNNDTGMFCIGNHTEVHFFRLTDGIFKEIDLNLPELPYVYGTYCYLPRISDDLSTLTIVCYSQPYHDLWFYRLSDYNGTWYAESFANLQASSLMGYADQDAQDGESFDVRVLLPEVCTLTVEVESDAAVINVKGVIE